MAHKSETHAEGSHFDPASCIQPEDRTPGQLKWDIYVNKQFHRLSKRQKYLGCCGQHLCFFIHSTTLKSWCRHCHAFRYKILSGTFRRSFGGFSSSR